MRASNVRQRNLTYVLWAMRGIYFFFFFCIGKVFDRSNVLRSLFEDVLHDEQGENDFYNFL